MRSRVLGILTAGLFAASAVNAEPVSWRFEGELTVVEGSDVDPAVVVGNPLSFELNFNPDTPVSNPVACGDGGVGTLCRHNSDPSMSFTNIQTNGLQSDFFGNPISNSITVRNDALVNNEPPPVDGYSFGATLVTGDETENYVIVIRGPEDLDLVTDGRVLPSTPPAGLLGLGSRVFQVCHSSDATLTCDIAYVEVLLTGVWPQLIFEDSFETP